MFYQSLTVCQKQTRQVIKISLHCFPAEKVATEEDTERSWSRPPSLLVNLCTLGHSAIYGRRYFFYFNEYTFVIYNSRAFRKYILHWGLRETSSSGRKAAPRNDGHLEYTNITISYTQHTCLLRESYSSWWANLKSLSLAVIYGTDCSDIFGH